MPDYAMHLELNESDPLLADRPALEAHMTAELQRLAEESGHRVAGPVALTIGEPSFVFQPEGVDEPIGATRLVRATAPVERSLVAGDPDSGLLVMGAVLGWANGTGGQSDGENLQMYALDNGPAPRWEKPHGRTVEKALRERGGSYEGDRFVVVRLRHGRSVTHDELADAVRGVAVLISSQPPAGSSGAASVPTTIAEAEEALRRAQHAAQVAGEAHALALMGAQERLAEFRRQAGDG